MSQRMGSEHPPHPSGVGRALYHPSRTYSQGPPAPEQLHFSMVAKEMAGSRRGLKGNYNYSASHANISPGSVPIRGVVAQMKGRISEMPIASPSRIAAERPAVAPPKHLHRPLTPPLPVAEDASVSSEDEKWDDVKPSPVFTASHGNSMLLIPSDTELSLIEEALVGRAEAARRRIEKLVHGTKSNSNDLNSRIEDHRPMVPPPLAPQPREYPILEDVGDHEGEEEDDVEGLERMPVAPVTMALSETQSPYEEELQRKNPTLPVSPAPQMKIAFWPSLGKEKSASDNPLTGHQATEAKKPEVMRPQVKGKDVPAPAKYAPEVHRQEVIPIKGYRAWDEDSRKDVPLPPKALWEPESRPTVDSHVILASHPLTAFKMEEEEIEGESSEPDNLPDYLRESFRYEEDSITMDYLKNAPTPRCTPREKKSKKIVRNQSWTFDTFYATECIEVEKSGGFRNAVMSIERNLGLKPDNGSDNLSSDNRYFYYPPLFYDEGLSCFLFGENSKLRRLLSRILKHKLHNLIMSLILILDIVMVSLTSSEGAKHLSITKTSTGRSFTEEQSAVRGIDMICLAVFTLEVIARGIAQGVVNERGCFRYPVFVLDATAITISWALFLFHDLVPFHVLRTFRVITLLQYLPYKAEYHLMVRSLLNCLSSVISNVQLLVFLLVLFSTLTLDFYTNSLSRRCVVVEDGKIYPTYPNIYYCNTKQFGGYKCNLGQQCIGDLGNPNHGFTHFDHFFAAVVNLFDMCTLNNWSQLYYSLGNAESTILTASWCIPMLILVSFLSINLFIGVVVNNFNYVRSEQAVRLLSLFANELDNNKISDLWMKLKAQGKTTEVLWSERIATATPGIRLRCMKLMISNRFFGFQCVVVLGNCALQAIKAGRAQTIQFVILDVIFLLALISEMALTLFAHSRVLEFFKNGWNTFSVTCLIVNVALFITKRDPFLCLINLRIIQLGLTTTRFKLLHRVLAASVHGIGSVFHVFLLLAVALYIYAVTGVQLFGGHLDTTTLIFTFDTLFDAFMVLFQVLTLDRWSAVMYSAMGSPTYGPIFSPLLSFGYFATFIFLVVFIVLNMVTSFIIENFALTYAEREIAKQKLWKRLETAYVAPSSVMQYSRSRSLVLLKEDERKSIGSKPEDATLVVTRWDMSLFIFRTSHPVRVACERLSKSSKFQYTIIVFVTISSVLPAFLPAREAFKLNTATGRIVAIVKFMDYLSLAVFSFEAIVKIIAEGFILKGKNGVPYWFSNNWNRIDFILLVLQFLSLVGEDLKPLRLARGLRPVRFVQFVKDLNLIVTSLLNSAAAIFDVVLLCLTMLFYFGVLATNIFGGKYDYCTYAGAQGKRDCTATYVETTVGPNYLCPRAWLKPGAQFDNLFSSLTILLQVSSLSNWADFVNDGTSVTGFDLQPVEGASRSNLAFFLVFTFSCSFYIVFIFIGVIIININTQRGTELLSAQQLLWEGIKKQIKITRPYPALLSPSGIIRKASYWVVEYPRCALEAIPLATVRNDTEEIEGGKMGVKRFVESRRAVLARVKRHNIPSYMENFMLVIILVNTLILCTDNKYTTPAVSSVFKIFTDYVFLSCYIIEVILMLLAYGNVFFRKPWCVFDLIITVGNVASVISVAINAPKSYVGPLQLFKIIRIVKLLRWDGVRTIRQMFATLLVLFPRLLRVSMLLLLLMYVYAVIGVEFFSAIKFGSNINISANFRSITSAMIILLRLVTLDGWDGIMRDCVVRPIQSGNVITGCVDNSLQADCGTRVAFVYYLSFFVIGSFVFFNLVIAIVVGNFSNFEAYRHCITVEDFQHFALIWQIFDPNATGYISRKDFAHLAAALHNEENALGYQLHPELHGMRFRATQALLFIVALHDREAAAEQARQAGSRARWMARWTRKTQKGELSFAEVATVLGRAAVGTEAMDFEEQFALKQRLEDIVDFIRVESIHRFVKRYLCIKALEKEVGPEVADRIRRVRGKLAEMKYNLWQKQCIIISRDRNRYSRIQLLEECYEMFKIHEYDRAGSLYLKFLRYPPPDIQSLSIVGLISNFPPTITAMAHDTLHESTSTKYGAP